ncbi:MAG: hypothetical protein Q7R41_19545 [Phycisphaerales bacterium]|nr:hypothetical protein [Phycisphaerales bacterium]
MFNHDWFHGPAFQEQQDEARWRCANLHFPDVPDEERAEHEGIRKLAGELDIRMLLYLRDGFSYEVKDIADVPSKAHLVFECVPVDEHYKVGAFVVSVAYEEIVRVEVFAVHPDEKPEEYPQITGFRSHTDQMDFKYGESKPPANPSRQPKVET